MARSSALLVLLAGCDQIVGLDAEVVPCSIAELDPDRGVDVVPAAASSIDWFERFAIVRSSADELAQYTLPNGPSTPIDVGIYRHEALALVPEGDALFFTAPIEPPVLQGAVRDGDAWRLVSELPVGTMAGTPSAREFGPRRVLVRLRAPNPEVQEFEEVEGRWQPVGEVRLLDGHDGPNLTPNGLTLAYFGRQELTDEGGTSLLEGVFIAGRATVDEPFGEPKLVLAGSYNSPQLLGRCSRLYVVDTQNSVLRRFDL